MMWADRAGKDARERLSSTGRKRRIGYWCRRSLQGRGYVTEAVNALTKIAFQELSAERVEIRCDSRNLPSRRVAERAGYQLEAELHSDARANDGSLRDTLIYVMLADDFDTNRSS